MWEGPSGSTLTTAAFGSLAMLHWKQSVRLQHETLMGEGSCAGHCKQHCSWLCILHADRPTYDAAIQACNSHADATRAKPWTLGPAWRS